MPEYTIMKIRGNFPEYEPRQDIDIVCRDMEGVAEYLMGYFFVDYEWRMNRRGNTHAHFDIINGGLELRFDLYGEFISERFTKRILDNRMEVKHSGTSIWIAGYHEDILIKAWEHHTNGKEKYSDYKKFWDEKAYR